jgi:hypothetical protein
MLELPLQKLLHHISRQLQLVNGHHDPNDDYDLE